MSSESREKLVRQLSGFREAQLDGVGKFELSSDGELTFAPTVEFAKEVAAARDGEQRWERLPYEKDLPILSEREDGSIGSFIYNADGHLEVVTYKRGGVRFVEVNLAEGIRNCLAPSEGEAQEARGRAEALGEWQEELEHSESDYREASEKLAEAQKRIAAITQTNKDLERHLDTANADLSGAKETIAKLTQERDAAILNAQSLRSDNAALTKRNAELRQERDSLRQENAELTEQVSHLEHRITQLKEPEDVKLVAERCHTKRLTEQAISDKKRIAELQSKLEGEVQDSNNNAAMAQSLEAELEEAQARILSLEADYAKSHGRIRTLEYELAALTQLLEQLS